MLLLWCTILEIDFVKSSKTAIAKAVLTGFRIRQKVNRGGPRHWVVVGQRLWGCILYFSGRPL